MFKAVLISSLAALLPGLLILGYEGSVIRYAGWIGAAILIYSFAVLGCIVIGLPIHFAMKRINVDGRMAYATAGFFSPLAILALGPIMSLDWSELIDPNNLEHALVVAIPGALVALALREMLERLNI